ncbi:MAG: hypothetical protein A3G33_09775 [Omnitrophica bacterium RIFCSPLOWO2_12_FULL_44_17]|uniref:HEAT repeat domain-containing protein n=1 Tax=Candidatus Danuiimicrobium aquiferis TaxID=1801832 RepID=A0A1G1KX07_9BACT|nr:MAG: hypothetical protein A3B72_09590 [Omnitrophica bacterium RIFCSPHIGHO2_02_FULL_45_28]OGW89329.1 MAG: hypothetical protein A3E74_08600 [Omnitrophica bacterium RIFCSPHIGHO2_12_FULL_44_12]OGW97468.1 MAG: hypothetical protein A3G33_09775 [Omnitrophica bacterium RIFCSPLOWO2_12_FULL_44_17]OGX04925.1 MAG: hypothetical protein A3J12_06550 [Omnitrophica bacterium RIFCSPLOWO2_02_FULL_44_11]
MVDLDAFPPNKKMNNGFLATHHIVIFSIGIAIGIFLTWLGYRIHTHQIKAPETLIEEMQNLPSGERWRKAFELSEYLRKSWLMLESEQVMDEIIANLKNPKYSDPRTRAYLILAISQFNKDKAKQAVLEVFSNLKKDEDPQVILSLMDALMKFGMPEVALPVASYLKSEHSYVREKAALLLGKFGNPAIIPDLKSVLTDSVTRVRWNAATSLAELGDNSGIALILQMLDRDYLLRAYKSNEEEIERIMGQALSALTSLDLGERATMLELLAKQDPSYKVRNKAQEVLKQQKTKIGLPLPVPVESVPAPDAENHL